ncbi:DUF982 domain-containing protein [Rhizobium mongolense]|uniref:DUF982 domain-containing protein n=1 Tax=Rhizobium mongolense TaxID=57676 RepID=UPI003556B45A
MLYRWPVSEDQWGEAHLKARLICYECFRGKQPAKDARDAFILALDEAGISIMNEDRVPRYAARGTDAKEAASQGYGR